MIKLAAILLKIVCAVTIRSVIFVQNVNNNKVKLIKTTKQMKKYFNLLLLCMLLPTVAFAAEDAWLSLIHISEPTRP